VLGGIGNIAGAMLGGLTLGVLESVGPFLLLGGANVPSPNQLRDVIALTNTRNTALESAGSRTVL